MTEDRKDEKSATEEAAAEYQSPAIEEVVTREGFEREVAYAGVANDSPFVP